MLIDVCVDKVQSAIYTKEAGTDRLELCQELIMGGTTPSKGLVISS